MNNTPEILEPSEWPSKFRAYKMNLLKFEKILEMKTKFFPFSTIKTAQTDSTEKKQN